jgi:hypothetical protein
MPPRKKAPPRPRKKVPARPKKSTAIKTPAKTAKEKKRLMPAVKPTDKTKPKKGKVSAGDKRFLAAKATLELEDIIKKRAATKKAARIAKEKAAKAAKKETRVERLKRLAKEP